MWTEICFYFAGIFFSMQIGTFLHPKSPSIKIFIFHHHFRKGMQMSHHYVYCCAFINYPSLKWNSSQHNRKLKNLHFWTRFSKSKNFSMNFLLLELNTHSLLFLFLFAFYIFFFFWRENCRYLIMEQILIKSFTQKNFFGLNSVLPFCFLQVLYSLFCWTI